MRRVVTVIGALCLPLSAMAEGLYLNAKLGMAAGSSNASELNRQINALGLNATATSSDDSRSAWGLGVGFRYTPRLSLELGYVDLGSVETSLSGTAVDVATFVSSVSDIHPQSATGWEMSVNYNHPLAEKVSLNLRGGVFHWDSRYTLDGGSVSRTLNANGSSMSFGVGAEMEVFANTRMGINYDRYDVDGEEVGLVSVGLRYGL